MSLQTIEVALPADLIEQIDAEVGPDHRSEFLAQVARDAVHRRHARENLHELVNAETQPVPGVSRFNPVPIMGEPASVTLLRDRGNY